MEKGHNKNETSEHTWCIHADAHIHVSYNADSEGKKLIKVDLPTFRRAVPATAR